MSEFTTFKDVFVNGGYRVKMECPHCGTPHVDEGEWATRLHHTHLCLNESCGKLWRPSDDHYFFGVTSERGFILGVAELATKKDLTLHWSGGKAGKRFRCHMCGDKFKEFDYWRCIYTNSLEGGKYGGNPLVCVKCDGDNVLDRWKVLCNEAYSPKFWSFRHE